MASEIIPLVDLELLTVGRVDDGSPRRPRFKVCPGCGTQTMTNPCVVCRTRNDLRCRFYRDDCVACGRINYAPEVEHLDTGKCVWCGQRRTAGAILLPVDTSHPGMLTREQFELIAASLVGAHRAKQKVSIITGDVVLCSPTLCRECRDKPTEGIWKVFPYPTHDDEDDPGDDPHFEPLCTKCAITVTPRRQAFGKRLVKTVLPYMTVTTINDMYKLERVEL